MDVPLLFDRAGGGRVPIDFRVDSGCSHTLMPLARATHEGLDTAGQAKRIQLGTALSSVPVDVIPQTYRFVLSARQRSAPFVLPVFLVVNQPRKATPLLGLGGVIDQLRWTLDGRTRKGFSYGRCILDDIRPADRRFPG